MKTIFAFDVGLCSLGEAVRQEDEIVHADSLLIDSGVADISRQAVRRRQYRSRLTHKAREKWWEDIWTSIGKQPLRGIHRENGKWVNDERLEREFADTKHGDSTVYTSCLLRILLLEGKKLEDWQIYKAIRSAFQRAGYPKVPWAKNNDEEKTIERVNDFTASLQESFPDARHHFPCYHDAWKMGLFDPKKGEIISFSQNHNAERARGYTATRELVEKELMLLLGQAAKQIPELRTKAAKKVSNPDKWREYIVRGPRAEDFLYFQTHFLLKLRNMLVEKNGENKKLSTEEIRGWYAEAEEKRKNYMTDCIREKQKPDFEKIAKFYKITPPSQWKRRVEKKGYTVYPGTTEVPSPKTTGRTAYSRPAMVLIRELILSGKPPHDFYQELLSSEFAGFSGMGLHKPDLDFLLRMKENDPQSIYIVPGSLAERYAGKHGGELEKGVMEIIGSTRDSKVRHRLAVFFERLKALMEKYEDPDSIIIEFAREDFSPKWRKKKYEKASRDNNNLYEDAKKELGKCGIDFRKQTKKLVLKFVLWKKQGHACPYTGRNISFKQLINDQCDIDHVIPREGGYDGPDAIENYVLTHSETNRNLKKERMPFECEDFIKDWEAFKSRVKGMLLSNKTKNILTCRSREETEKLIERYYGLAVTGWVARLARDIVCLWMGWEPGAEGKKRKLHVVSGSLVGKIRRKYHLNESLSPVTAAMVPDGQAEEDGAEEDKQTVGAKKNREDARHHALDAMVMTYLAEYARDIRKFDRLKLPEGRNHPKYFAQKLEELNVVPHKVARVKATLGETAYRVIKRQVIERRKGKRIVKEEQILLRTKSIREIQTVKDAQKIIDPQIRRQVEEFFRKNPKPSPEDKETFYAALKLKGYGPKILKVKVVAGDPKTTKKLTEIGRGSYYQSDSSSAVGTLQHGIYLYVDRKGKWGVCPVYAFNSPWQEKEKLIKTGFSIKDNALFYTGCVVEVINPIPEKDIDPGYYILKTIIEKTKWVKLKDIHGNEKPGLSLSAIADNFRFVR